MSDSQLIARKERERQRQATYRAAERQRAITAAENNGDMQYQTWTWDLVNKLRQWEYDMDDTMDEYEDDVYWSLVIYSPEVTAWCLHSMPNKIAGWCLCGEDENFNSKTKHKHAHIIMRDYKPAEFRKRTVVFNVEGRHRQMRSRRINCRLHMVASLHYVSCVRASQGDNYPWSKDDNPKEKHYHSHLSIGWPHHSTDTCTESIKALKQVYQTEEHLMGDCKCWDTDKYQKRMEKFTSKSATIAQARALIDIIDTDDECKQLKYLKCLVMKSATTRVPLFDDAEMERQERARAAQTFQHLAVKSEPADVKPVADVVDLTDDQ